MNFLNNAHIQNLERSPSKFRPSEMYKRDLRPGIRYQYIGRFMGPRDRRDCRCLPSSIQSALGSMTSQDGDQDGRHGSNLFWRSCQL